MIKSIKHKNPFHLKVGDLFYWDRQREGKDKERLYFAVVVKVNNKTIDLHFRSGSEAESCGLKGKLYFSDPHRVRVNKLNLQADLSNIPTIANYRSRGSCQDELYFIGTATIIKE